MRIVGWLAAGALLAFEVEVKGADVGYFGVVKSVQYAQTNDSNAPVVSGTNAFMFTAFAVASTNGVLTNATVKTSISSTLNPIAPDSNGLSWRFEERFASQSALDTKYPVTVPSGFGPVNYTLTFSTTNDGIRSASVNFYLLIMPVTAPGTPRLTDLASLRDVDTTRDTVVMWNPLSGSLLSIVQLTVLDAASNLVWTTPAPFQSNALTSTSTSVMIPANSLPGGMSLTGHLTIANPAVPNTNSYPGAMGVAALAKDTEFPIVTRPAPVPPVLQVVRAAPGEPVQVLLTGESNRFYQIHASEDSVNWTNQHAEYSVSGRCLWSDTEATNQSYRFYRGKVGQ